MILVRILALIAILTAALGYMIWERMNVLASGQTVTLKVVPVDPTDMFRGDYVILRYEISRIEPANIAGDDVFYSGETVYVTLAEANGLWAATAVNKTMPAPPSGVVIKGTVDNVMYSSGENQPPPPINVSYGIESFFVPQGRGKEIEDDRQKGEITADIAIDAQGAAAIKALKRESEVLAVEGFF